MKMQKPDTRETGVAVASYYLLWVQREKAHSRCLAVAGLGNQKIKWLPGSGGSLEGQGDAYFGKTSWLDQKQFYYQ